MFRVALVLSLALSAGGCHAKFKKHVGAIDAVRPDMPVPGGPMVRLGTSGDDSLFGIAVNVAQGVKSIDLTRRVSDAVDPAQVTDAFLGEMDQALGKGPPFDLDSRAETILEIQLLDYAIDVAGIGTPGALTYSLSTRVYLPDGERVYTANHNCAVPFGDPSALSVVFGAVNNSRAIKDMSPEELQDMFDGGARWCAQQTVLRIRRHGS